MIRRLTIKTSTITPKVSEFPPAAWTRRQFLQATAVAAAALPLTSPVGAGETPTPPDGLPRRVLGKTGVSVTILGLGCAWLWRDRQARDKRGSEAYTQSVIDAALEGGIRYFDTAPNYFKSEERLGPALAPVRDRVFLTTKLDHGDAKTAEQDLTRSLKLLKTDHVDLLLLHGLGLPGFDDFEALAGKDGALTFLRQARARGLTRFIGFSSHPVMFEAQQRFLEVQDVNVIQPFINYISRAENNVEERLVPMAGRKNIGVVAMKVLGGDGQLADDCDRAFRYVLSVPGVQCALIGASSPEEVRRAVRAAREFRPLTEAEMRETLALGRKLFESQSKKAARLRRHRNVDWGNDTVVV